MDGRTDGGTGVRTGDSSLKGGKPKFVIGVIAFVGVMVVLIVMICVTHHGLKAYQNWKEERMRERLDVEDGIVNNYY